MALAEVSAFGIGLAFLSFGLVGQQGPLALWWHRWGPLVCAGGLAVATVLLVGARAAEQWVSREGLIGVGYALAGGLALLLVWKSAEGLEELRHLLHGDVLLVEPWHLRLLVGTAAGVLGLMALCRRQLLFAAYDPEMAASLGLRAGWWLRVLFLLMGLSIALSTWIGGAVLAFALLVVPPFAALLVCERFYPAVALSVAIALGASAVGLVLAVRLDYPIPQAVVAALLVPLGAAVLERTAGPRRLVWAAVVPGLVLSLAGLAVAGLGRAGRAPLGPAAHRMPPAVSPSPAEPHAHPPHAHRAHQLPAASEHAPAQRQPLPLLLELLEHPEPRVRAAALQALAELGEPAAAAAILERAPHEPADLRVLAARTLVRLGERRGLELLIELLAAPEVPPLVREDAAAALRELAGRDFGYDPLASPDAPANREAIAAWRRWYQAR
ncbi:MAG: hypothetical protein KatS3mg102_0423 [Planctomycetota bacterium]|nr:MAG: hypothetical protein KatS3mg102_0423 [Planctomycetota bacterium]